MALLFLAVVAGIFLGLFCHFLILLPVTLAAIIVGVGGSLWAGHGIGTTLVAAIVPVICLQGGYMIGLTARDLTAQVFMRANRVQSKRV